VNAQADDDRYLSKRAILATVMSDRIVEVFRRLVEAVNRADLDAIRLLTVEDAVVIPQRASTEGAYHGHEGFRAFFADNAETFELFRLDYPDIRDLGDRVLAIGTVHIRGRGSGIETDIPSAGVATFRGGKLASWEDFGDRRFALEAAGLAPE
jgi:ketosteroid isomerase-like protein